MALGLDVKIGSKVRVGSDLLFDMDRKKRVIHTAGVRLHGHNRSLLRVPRTVVPDGSVPFRRVQKLFVPEAPGVYLVHDLRGTLYVGRTCDLHRRFIEHYELGSNELLLMAVRQPFGEIKFSWMLVNDEAERAQLERDLVCWLQPPCNRALPGLKKFV